MDDPLYNQFFDSQHDSIQRRLQKLERGGQLRRGGAVVSTGDFTTVPDDIVGDAGKINLATSAIDTQGAISPTVADGTFTASATTTSITWYWDNTNGSKQFVLRRSDGTTFVVPKGSIAITGLTINTKYYFLPFWATMAGCSVGWVVGTAGTPKIAIGTLTAAMLAQQTMVSREALSAGAMSYSTTAAGTSTGNAGDGGGLGLGGVPKCVMSGTEIEPLGDGELSIEILPEESWMLLQALDGCHLSATPNHRVATPHRGFVALVDLSEGELVITKNGEYPIVKLEPFKRACTKHSPHLSRGHLYWANGILSHNFKANVT